MTAKRSKSSRFSKPSRRTQIVWAIFLGAMTVVTGLLALTRSDIRSGFLLTSVDVVGGGQAAANDPVFRTDTPLDRKRWTSIVIHHSGEPAGDADSVARAQQRQNIKGLGYHFLIGNGNGLGDGVVHVGFRWDRQLPGAHVQGASALADGYNQHAIGICLIGNGDRRAFTDRQMTELANLVQRLQRELGIPADHVYLHRDLASGTSSPGTYFAAASFQEQLVASPR